MQVFQSLPNPPLLEPTDLTIGNFDGVHLGHQALLNAMIDHARQHQHLAGLLTFHPHPVVVLRPEVKHHYLTTVDERLRLLADAGLDFTVIQPFDTKLARMEAQDFLIHLRSTLNLAMVWVGPDFALGRDRKGDVAALRAMGEKLGFGVQVISPRILGSAEVRSGRIRVHLLEGDVDAAAQQLGRPYRIAGVVVPGVHRGRSIGFPTANLDVPNQRLLPANGVYATWAHLSHGAPLASVTNIGVRPSFDNGERTVETHLLNFEGELYGQQIGLEFVARLRPEMRFPNPDALRVQIASDVKRAHSILEANTLQAT
jgi:riboflavin kinase/FMN adenylyltransferase